MSEGYRPDGPTARKARTLVQNHEDEMTPYVAAIMALAREVDQLRETMIAEMGDLQAQVDDHVEAPDGRHNYTRGTS